jgi:MarR family transcriptional regulator, organic hydroperoxide resistance regulator
MSDCSPHEGLSSQIIGVARAHRSRAAELLGALGLYPGQEMFLFWLQREDGQTLSQIAERMGVQPPTVTKMVTRMEASGLLERRASPRDSRVTQVFLTEHANTLLPEIERVWVQLEDETTSGMNPEDRALMRQLLMRVFENLNRSNPVEEP